MLNYTITFADRKNDLWRIEIDNPNYNGTHIDLTPANEPLKIEFNGNDDDDKFKKLIINSTATIQVVSTGLDLDTLMSINDGSFKCRIYHASTLYWQGYLISDGIQDKDSGVPFDVTLKAIDGIELAQNIIYEGFTDRKAITINGELGSVYCPLKNIIEIFNNPKYIDNPLPIRWNVTSVRSQQYPNSDMLGGRNKLNVSGELVGKKYNAQWWLNETAKSALGVRVVLRLGAWYIIDDEQLIADGGIFKGYELLPNSDTATSVSVDFNQYYSPLNAENSWFGVKKPLGSINVIYNNSTVSDNVIPNGGFDDIEDGKVRYWYSNSDVIITPGISLNNREGNSMQVYNPDTQLDNWVTYGEIPIDANILYKNCNIVLTASPFSGFSKNPQTGIIEDGQLRIRVSYTGYQDASLRKLYLNENGFWQGFGIVGGISVERTEVNQDNNVGTVYFTGETAQAGQVYRVSYLHSETLRIVEYTYTFVNNESLSSALSTIAFNTNGTYISGNSIYYNNVLLTISVSLTTQETSLVDIKLDFSGARETDVITYQFQSRGNANGIIMPDPNVLDVNRLPQSGKLSFEIFSKHGTVAQYDDCFLSFSSNNDVYEISIPITKNPTENYDMGISSSFSGNMVSSYMDRFNLSDQSMLWNDNKTLTQLYGEKILRYRSKPLRLFQGDMDGLYHWGVFSIKGKKYVPLSITVDCRRLESNVTAVECDYSYNGRAFSVVHRGSNDDNTGNR